MFKKALVFAMASAILSVGNSARIGLNQYHDGQGGQQHGSVFQNYGVFQQPGGQTPSLSTQILTEVETVATIQETPEVILPLTYAPT